MPDHKPRITRDDKKIAEQNARLDNIIHIIEDLSEEDNHIRFQDLDLAWVEGSHRENKLTPSNQNPFYNFIKKFGYHSNTFKQLRAQIKKISAGTTSFDFSNENLGSEFNGAEFSQLFKFIPASVTSLDFSENQLFHLKGLDRIKFFTAIPRTVTELYLKRNKLCDGHIYPAEIIQCIQALPEHLTSLNLSDNNLEFLETNIMIDFFKALPQTLTSLNLRRNHFAFATDLELAEMFAALPRSITSLNLGRMNDLDRLTGPKLAAIFRALPAIKFLNLNSNLLGKLNPNEFVEAFRALPNTIQSLDLEGNALGRLPGDSLAAALQAITAPIQSLDLSTNWRRNFHTYAALEKIFRSIPKTVNFFHINNNDFWNIPFEIEKLAQAFHAIPSGVTELDIQSNGWQRLTDLELKLLFHSLPHSIHTLHIDESDSLFDGIPIQEILKIYEAIPPSISTLHVESLDGEDLVSDGGAELTYKEKLTAIFKSFPRTITSLHMNVSYFLEEIKSEEYREIFSFLPEGLILFDISKDKRLRFNKSYEDLLTFLNSLPENISEVWGADSIQGKMQTILEQGRYRIFQTVQQETHLTPEVASIVMNYIGDRQRFWPKRKMLVAKENIPDTLLDKFILR